MSELPPSHPALSLPEFCRVFGPLLFPLYRAALLRKRILLVGEAPVHENCDLGTSDAIPQTSVTHICTTVYDLSVISSVPASLLHLLPVDGVPSLRLQPLFNVGVYDIDSLRLSESSDNTWIACTTDDVLATKPELFDLLVLLPPTSAKDGPSKIYPRLVESDPSLSRNFPKASLKATQRDARRYRSMRGGLKTLPSYASGRESGSDNESVGSLASSALSNDSVIERTPWSLAAYESFIWWASAGEERAGLTERDESEREQDRGLLLADLDTMEAVIPGHEGQEAPQEVALVAYFQRLTALIFSTISNAISRQGGEELRNDEFEEYHDGADGEEAVASSPVHTDADDQPLLEPESDEPVEISSEDMEQMGLDIWSAADRKFVEELVRLWWGRQADVRGGKIECCGIRLQ